MNFALWGELIFYYEFRFCITISFCSKFFFLLCCRSNLEKNPKTTIWIIQNSNFKIFYSNLLSHKFGKKFKYHFPYWGINFSAFLFSFKLNKFCCYMWCRNCNHAFYTSWLCREYSIFPTTERFKFLINYLFKTRWCLDIYGLIMCIWIVLNMARL